MSGFADVVAIDKKDGHAGELFEFFGWYLYALHELGYELVLHGNLGNRLVVREDKLAWLKGDNGTYGVCEACRQTSRTGRCWSG